MIRESTYFNALQAARHLADAGHHLQARQGSLLAELFDASVSVQTQQTTNLPSILANNRLSANTLLLSEQERALAVTGATYDYEAASEHSKRLNAMADDLSPYVTAHIQAARNVVAPKVLELADKLQKFVETAKPLDPSAQFEIQQRSIPALLLDDAFLADNLEQYDGVDAKFGYDDFKIEYDKLDDAYFRELANLGSERQNGLLRAWLGGLSPDFLKEVLIHSVMGVPFDDPYRKDGLNFNIQGTRNVYEQIDLHLGLYLVAQRLFNSPPPAKGVSLDQFKIMARKLITYAGTTLLKQLKTAARQLEAKILVIETLTSRKRVVVAKPIYQAWLNEGGCPEVLLGMIVSGRTTFNVAATNEQKDALVRAWQNYVMLSQADVRAELRQRFISYVEAEMMNSLDELTELEQDYYQDNYQYKQLVLTRVKAEIEQFHHRLFDDLHHTALHLVAKARFWFTSAYDILNEMNQVAKENPDIDPREAGLLSAIDYYAEYVVDQIDCVK